MLKSFQKITKGRAWLISVDMGYGHQRTAFSLKYLAVKGKVINANSYQGIPEKDRKLWERARKFYELISNFKRIPLIGEFAFSLFDKFQKIHPFYPKRDLSSPSLQLRQTYFLIKKGWGKDFVERLNNKEHLPIVSTFFVPAFMAEVHGYNGPIFCVICDADISRTWAPLEPKKSKIKYFAPNQRVVERLRLYGVKKENIFLTGYPLPKEDIGTTKLEILKNDLAYRILNLDQEKKFLKKYSSFLKKNLGNLPKTPGHPLTIMFAVGGAGAQKEIGTDIIKSLKKEISEETIKIILVAGIKRNIKDYFLENIKKLELENNLGKSIEIIFEKNIEAYFRKFNRELRQTDILWTKSSELSFYTALGLPIIIAPPIGSQEDFNKEWLLKLGAGICQKNPKYTNRWLFDFLKSGSLAKMAVQGFIKAEKLGVLNIEKMIKR